MCFCIRIGLNTRGIIMARIDFGGVKETVVTRKEFPMAKAKRILRNEPSR